MKKVTIIFILLSLLLCSFSCKSGDNKAEILQMISNYGDYSDKATNHAVSVMNYAEYENSVFVVEDGCLLRHYFNGQNDYRINDNVVAMRNIGDIILYMTRANNGTQTLFAYNRTTLKTSAIIRGVYDYIIMNGKIVYRKQDKRSQGFGSGLFRLETDVTETELVASQIAAYWQHEGALYYVDGIGNIWRYTSTGKEELLIKKERISVLCNNAQYTNEGFSLVRGYFYDGVRMVPYAANNTLYFFVNNYYDNQKVDLWTASIGSEVSFSYMGVLYGLYQYTSMQSVIFSKKYSQPFIIDATTYDLEYFIKNSKGQAYTKGDFLPRPINEELYLWQYPYGTDRFSGILTNGLIYANEEGEIAYKPKFVVMQ